MLLLLCVCVCVCSLGQAQDRTASLWRGNDRGGRCQYSFTVASPAEASCPGPAPNAAAAGPELEALRTRLGLLEALVSRLVATAAAGEEAGSASSGSEPPPPPGEGERLRAEKRVLEGELEALQRRTDAMRAELEKLRSRPCPPQRPPPTPPHSPALQDSSLDRPSAGRTAPRVE